MPPALKHEKPTSGGTRRQREDKAESSHPVAQEGPWERKGDKAESVSAMKDQRGTKQDHLRPASKQLGQQLGNRQTQQNIVTAQNPEE